MVCGCPFRRSVTVLIASAMVLGAAALMRDVAAAPRPHDPIRIEGDAEFTTANGVVSGSGRLDDPFVVEGWDISAIAADGIVVRNTTSPFVVRDIAVSSGGASYSGVVLENVTGARVESSTLAHNANGILVRSSSEVVLQGNAITQNTWAGVSLIGTANARLNGNNVTYNRDGVNVQAAVSLVFQGNGVWLNSQDGAYLSNLSDAQIEGSTFASNSWVGLHVVDARNLTLRVNTAFSNGRDGISIDESDGVSIRTNTAFSNLNGGIRLYGVANASLVQNDVSSNRDAGIVVEDSRGAEILENLVSASGYGGIVLGSMTDTVVNGNRVSNGDYGISLVLVSRATLRFNKAILSRASGIYVVASDNVTLTQNNASRNANGVAIESTKDGVMRDNTIGQNELGIRLFHSVRLVVAGNQILENVVQGFDESGPENQWDVGYPLGGNFWSDYRGFDRCHGTDYDMCDDPDGIGDAPYDIDADSRDRYPLMRPPGSPNAAPVASFEIAPSIGNSSLTFTLDASSSYDLEDNGSSLELRWDFDGDGVWDTPWSNERQVEHAFAATGLYVVRLEVRDSAGLTSITTRGVAVSLRSQTTPFPALDALTSSIVVLLTAAAALGFAHYRRMRRRIG